MCLRDLLTALKMRGIEVTESQIRWAIKSGQVSRPPLDGSLRFNFDEDHLREITTFFASKGKATAGGRELNESRKSRIRGGNVCH
jgi:hypothetical protein